jgi:hypothetical protein
MHTLMLMQSHTHTAMKYTTRTHPRAYARSHDADVADVAGGLFIGASSPLPCVSSAIRSRFSAASTSELFRIDRIKHIKMYKEFSLP